MASSKTVTEHKPTTVYEKKEVYKTVTEHKKEKETHKPEPPSVDRSSMLRRSS